MKVIETKQFLDTLCQLASEGKTVSTIVSGGSMSPFLANNRDTVFMEQIIKPPKKGDIVLFQRDNNDYVLHRIRKVSKKGYFLIGDRQYSTEGPVSSEQLRLNVISAKRKNKIITPKSLLWQFYSKIWLNMIFLRPAIFRIHGFFSKKS